MKKSFWCKENIIISIFLLLFLVSFSIILKFPISELSKSENTLMSTRVAYYIFPLLIVSMSVLILILANKLWGLKTLKSRKIKWLLGICLILVGSWYILLVNNFIGPLILPETLAKHKALSFPIFQKCILSSLLTYKGTLLLELYSVGLYLSIT